MFRYSTEEGSENSEQRIHTGFQIREEEVQPRQLAKRQEDIWEVDSRGSLSSMGQVGKDFTPKGHSATPRT